LPTTTTAIRRYTSSYVFFEEIFPQLNNCTEYAGEAQALGKIITEIIYQPDYTKKVFSHFGENLNVVSDRLAIIQSFIAYEMILAAGKEMGKLFNFIVLMNDTLKPNTTTTFLTLFKTQEFSEFSWEEFIKGFINGTNLLSALPSAQTCDPYNDRVKSNLTDLITLIGNTSLFDIQTLIAKGGPLVGDIINEYVTDVIPKCVKAENETVVLYEKLAKHVSQDGYTTKIIEHAAWNVFEVINRGSNIQGFIAAEKHFEAGIESGSLFNFVFLHDFVL